MKASNHDRDSDQRAEEEAPFAATLARMAAGAVALAGVWLMVSPWVLPGQYPVGGTWDNMACGLTIAVLMGMKARRPMVRWYEWAAIGVGLWVLVAPWILGHWSHVVAVRNEVVTATLVCLIASGSALATMYMLGPPMILSEER